MQLVCDVLFITRRAIIKFYSARTPMAFLDSYMSLARCMPDASAEHMSCFSCPDFEASVARMATKCMIDHSFKALPASAIATGIIYFTRGFGIVAWSHSIYDLIVLTKITTN